MRMHRSRHVRAGTALAALFISGALLAVGTTPAQASAPPATTKRSVEIETHLTGASSDVHSISIEAPGIETQCVMFDPGLPYGGYRYLRDPHWTVNYVELPWRATYDVYSYSDDHCTGVNYFIGSHGTISPSVSKFWAVYNARGPKRAF